MNKVLKTRKEYDETKAKVEQLIAEATEKGVCQFRIEVIALLKVFRQRGVQFAVIERRHAVKVLCRQLSQFRQGRIMLPQRGLCDADAAELFDAPLQQGKGLQVSG